MIPDTIEHFIGGEHLPSADGATFGVADPVGNKEYARAAAGGRAASDDGFVTVTWEQFAANFEYVAVV